MSIPGPIVQAARTGWKWQWNQLMNALAPCDELGNYRRPQSEHKSAKVLSEHDLARRTKDQLPILIIGKSCPWAHRAWLIYTLKNLNKSINIIEAKPSPNKGKWHFNPQLLGCNYLDEVYNLCNSPTNHRSTVPTLIDPCDLQTKQPKILGNESAQLIEVLNQWPTEREEINLYPNDKAKEINKWNNLLQSKVNDGVYRCGFARNQIAYELASKELFNSLEKIEDTLRSGGPWICGEEMTLTDIRLFPTLIRWETIYMPLFGCSAHPLWRYPKIWEWRKKLFNIPKVSMTCDSDKWRKDYFGNLFPLRPNQIIPENEELVNIVNANPPKTL